MSDEVEVVTPEAAPQVSREQIAEALGVTTADLDKFKNLDKWQREVARQSTEIGQIRKQQQAQPAEDDDFTESDVKAAEKLLTKTLGMHPKALAAAVDELRRANDESINATDSAFFKSYQDVSKEEVYARVLEMGVDTSSLTPARVNNILENARKAIIAERGIDMDAIREELRKELLGEIAPKPGEQVVEVKPKKGAPSDGKRSVAEAMDDDSLSFFDKLALFSK